VNGSLLAASALPFSSEATCLALLRAPEWMLESLPLAASGHADGSVRTTSSSPLITSRRSQVSSSHSHTWQVRWWSVREPASGVALPTWRRGYPAAVSRLPVRPYNMPAWELYELRGMRLEHPSDGTPTAPAPPTPLPVGLPATAVTALTVGEGFEKLLWSATADGRVRAWKAPQLAADDASAPADAPPVRERRVIGDAASSHASPPAGEAAGPPAAEPAMVEPPAAAPPSTELPVPELRSAPAEEAHAGTQEGGTGPLAVEASPDMLVDEMPAAALAVELAPAPALAPEEVS
jgi:hypothetical protein